MPDVRFSNALIRYRDRDKESWRPQGYLSEEVITTVERS